MFEELERINTRPEPFESYSASALWTDEYTSKQMLSYHLNGNTDLSSRNARFIERSVEWIVSRFSVGAGTKIADFGCGPGLYTTKLARSGADVTGVDFSKRSIQYARGAADRESLSIRYITENYLEFETNDRFDLVLLIMCDLCALSPAQRDKMLRKFYTILKGGGAILLDVYSLTAFEEHEERAMYRANLLDGFWSPDKYYGFLNTFKYQNEKVVVDKYTIIEKTRTRIAYNWFQYFSPETLQKELTECGFTIENLYSDVAGASFDPRSKEFAVVARKP
jgi:SAM-dependent methyltransferase